ncbi:hypothetical protein JB92DRAFT_3066475 [Gautieria morchelliformis]|nr:hypothetical protein JB92DRAFT_3066475 [Gautieria morchelliformis]
MADDAERAAKAARAKAMLKKRQQQKAGISASPSSASGANIAPSSKPPSPMTHSPEHKDVSSLFGASDKTGIDFGELGVLSPSRGLVSPPPVTPPPASELSPTSPNSNGVAETTSVEMKTLLSNQQQTISLLVNEKASLATQLAKLEALQTKFSENQAELEQERHRAENLAVRLQHAEDEARTTAARLDEVERRERNAHEMSRIQDRELDVARRTAGEWRAQLESRDRELSALKEKVEADDRVETLERSLRATQDRTEELEFQLSKVRQNHASSMQERETLAWELASLNAREAELTQRHATLEHELTSAQHQLTTVSSSLDDTERARANLENALATNETSLASIQQQLAHASSELTSHARQLHATEDAVSSAQRRAEDAEQAQRSLQAENSGLLAQLEEVRPKVVELINKNAEADERIWAAEKEVSALEANVAKLEAQLAESVATEAKARLLLESAEGKRQRDDEKHLADLREIQDAYASAVRDVEHAKERAAKLEIEHDAERSAMLAKARDHDRWKSEAASRAAEATAAMSELSAQRQTENDAIAISQRAQAEIESLRDQLALREDELMRLREDAPSSSSSRPHSPIQEGQRSLSQEMVSVVRQQHALDLSTAHSRIRALETEVFEAQAAAHTFQRRVTALEAELVQLNTHHIPDVAGRSTPPFPRRASFQDGSEDSRRHSLSSTRPHTPSSLRSLIVPRVVYDENLSAATRHKRKVSLSMLKARIESERAAAQHSTSVSVVGSPRLSQIHGLSSIVIAEADESLEMHRGERTPRKGSDARSPSVLSEANSQPQSNLELVVGKGKRPGQFLDESHVFWCHSCRGDLVVL